MRQSRLEGAAIESPHLVDGLEGIDEVTLFRINHQQVIRDSQKRMRFEA
jgi:hypothetical protein